MKERLTSEQSAELIKRGIDPTKASCFEAKRRRIVGVNIGRFNPIFTLADLLLLLPKKIKGKGHLKINMYPSICDIDYKGSNKSVHHVSSSSELIDALYLAVLWCIENNHLKF